MNIGKPLSRIDGRAKVTGTAKYAAEWSIGRMTYAFPVRATIAKGTITAIDTRAAQNSAGVIAVLTHQNAPRLKAFDAQGLQNAGGNLGEDLVPLQDNQVHYFGQFVGLIVAETYEQARFAATLFGVTYASEKPAIELEIEAPNGTRPKILRGKDAQLNLGKAAPIIAASTHKIEGTYSTPTEVHQPMEPHAAIAVWDGTDMTLYDTTQGVMVRRGTTAYLFGLAPENVRVISPFVGGAFGCKGGGWAYHVLAGMAAQVVKRPVKLAITRQMMQNNVGRRSSTIQQVGLGADADGKLTAIRHHSDSYHNLTEFIEPSGLQTAVLYQAPLREITYRVAQLDIGAPTYMRAPGEASGSFALESAIDELAFEMGMDPLEFRILNRAGALDPSSKLPFSSEHLLECYRIGAQKFGWQNRKIAPRQTRIGRQLVGFGMATATYPGSRSSASARVRMMANGEVKVMTASAELGTGTYTVLAQSTADALGVPVGRVAVQIGDSTLPPAPLAAGSQTTASIHPAVLAAGEMLRGDLLKLALSDPKSRLFSRNPAEISFGNGGFFLQSDARQSDSYADIMRRSGKTVMESCATTMPASGPDLGAKGAPCMTAPLEVAENHDDDKFSFHSFGAQFVEVWVDEDLGTIRVKRLTSVHDVGRIMNEKTARSQIIGGAIFGIGSALMEKTEYDPRWANTVTRTLADYHVPVNLDVPPIDVYFIGKPDPHISPLGARGVGEIGIVGVSAAIANAVFNATGKRLRDLPLTPDKLL